MCSKVSYRARNFVGRKVELEVLHRYFGESCTEQRIAVLWGVRGMDKTQLALKYQGRHRSTKVRLCILYIWITCTDGETIVRSFQGIAQSLVAGVNQLFPDTNIVAIARSLGIRNADSLDATLTTIKDVEAVGLINIVKQF